VVAALTGFDVITPDKGWVQLNRFY
jgi:hypothetical protein